MKGARMKFYYPSPFLREMSDIDILIHGDFMEQAAVELEAMGYVLQQKIKHHDIYRKAPGIVVEAHRAMYDRTDHRIPCIPHRQTYRRHAES